MTTQQLDAADATSTSDAALRTAATQQIEYLRRRYAVATDQIGVNTEASIASGVATYHEIFTPDAIARVTGEGTTPMNTSGPDAWAKIVTDALGEYAATQHLIGTQLVEIDALVLDPSGNVVSGEASMSSYLQAWHAGTDNNVWVFIGTYYDKVRFTPGKGWQIYDMNLMRVSGETRPMGTP